MSISCVRFMALLMGAAFASSCTEKQPSAVESGKSCKKSDFDTWGALTQREGEQEGKAICMLYGTHAVGTTYTPDPQNPEPCPQGNLKYQKWRIVSQLYFPNACSINHFPPYLIRRTAPQEVHVRAGAKFAPAFSCPPGETCEYMKIQGLFSSSNNIYAASAPGMTLFVQGDELVGEIPADLAGNTVRLKIVARNQLGSAEGAIDLVIR